MFIFLHNGCKLYRTVLANSRVLYIKIAISSIKEIAIILRSCAQIAPGCKFAPGCKYFKHRCKWP